MTEHFALVPGYVVRAEKPGPDHFQNVKGLGWTDQQGFTQGGGTTYRGRGGTLNWFHFPITNPTVLNGVRLSCNLAAVTLNLRSGAILTRFHLWDRVNRFFTKDGLSVGGDLSDIWSQGQNQFEFDHVVDGAIGISIAITFSSDTDVTFTGAGLRFHD
jgi:hypothetical protein